MDLPICLGWLVEDHSMKHGGVGMQPNCKAHKSLDKPNKLRAQPRFSSKYQNQIQGQQQQVEDVGKCLQHY
uniref:Uncharacterized protein n=1 Tax=Rhizophora mucronata TaxID=61149 RepID=A0A2P2QDS4_RHIMU